MQAREGFQRRRPSGPASRLFGDEGDLEPTLPPRRSKRSRDPQVAHSTPKSREYETTEQAPSVGKDDVIPKEFAWMNTDQYRTAVLAQQQTDEAKGEKGAAQSLPKSEEIFPTTTSQLTGEDAAHKEHLSHSLKSGEAFPHEVPWELPRSGYGAFGKEDKGRKAPGKAAFSQKKMERAYRYTGWEDLSSEQEPMHGAVAESGPGGNFPSYDSATPASRQNEEGPSDVLLSAELVPDEAQSPTLTRISGERLPFAEATVVPYKRRRRLVIGLLLLFVMGVILGVVFALKRSDDPVYKVLLTIVFRLDSNPHETGWTLECSSHTVTHIPPGYYKQPNVTSMVLIEVAEGDNCTLTVIDTGGDGIDGGYFAVYFGDVTEEDEDPSFRLDFISGDFTNETSGVFTSVGPSETEPSFCPSAAPSHSPLSHEPTLEGQTSLPTSYPTTMPPTTTPPTTTSPTTTPPMTTPPTTTPPTTTPPTATPPTMAPTVDPPTDPPTAPPPTEPPTEPPTYPPTTDPPPTDPPTYLPTTGPPPTRPPTGPPPTSAPTGPPPTPAPTGPPPTPAPTGPPPTPAPTGPPPTPATTDPTPATTGPTPAPPPTPAPIVM